LEEDVGSEEGPEADVDDEETTQPDVDRILEHTLVDDDSDEDENESSPPDIDLDQILENTLLDDDSNEDETFQVDSDEDTGDSEDGDGGAKLPMPTQRQQLQDANSRLGNRHTSQACIEGSGVSSPAPLTAKEHQRDAKNERRRNQRRKKKVENEKRRVLDNVEVYLGGNDLAFDDNQELCLDVDSGGEDGEDRGSEGGSAASAATKKKKRKKKKKKGGNGGDGDGGGGSSSSSQAKVKVQQPTPATKCTKDAFTLNTKTAKMDYISRDCNCVMCLRKKQMDADGTPAMKESAKKLDNWLSKGAKLARHQARNSTFLFDAATVGHVEAARALLAIPGIILNKVSDPWDVRVCECICVCFARVAGSVHFVC
jgi:hypothetical protein